MRSKPPSASFRAGSVWLSATGSPSSTPPCGTNSLSRMLPQDIWTPLQTRPSAIYARGAAGSCEASREPEVLAVLCTTSRGDSAACGRKLRPAQGRPPTSIPPLQEGREDVVSSCRHPLSCRRCRGWLGHRLVLDWSSQRV